MSNGQLVQKLAGQVYFDQATIQWAGEETCKHIKKTEWSVGEQLRWFHLTPPA